MKQKLLSLCAALCCTLFITASAEKPSGTCGEHLNWEFDSETQTLTITGYGAMDDFEYIQPWGEYRNNIKFVSLPDGLTNIAISCFADHHQLVSVEVPGSVLKIGASAFYNCLSLYSVKLNEGLKTIGDGAFCYCPTLSTMNMPESVDSIGDNVWNESKALSQPLYNSKLFARMPVKYVGSYDIQCDDSVFGNMD